MNVFRTTRLLASLVASWLAVAAIGCGSDDGTTGVGGAGATTGIGGSGGSGGSEPICGDGTVAATEACDDGNLLDGDGCSSVCAVEPGFTCDAAGCSPICGDGLVLGDETCDDGGTSAGDGCDASCAIEAGYDCIGEPSLCSAVCGDGIVLPSEACDDGNLDAGDGCSATCVVEAGFDCDDSEPSVCDGICGDGFVLGSETCDDGNLDPDDGCSATCAVELGWSCADEPSVCTPDCGDGLVNGMETCDDGNLDGGDGCSAGCQEETGYDCVGEPSVCEEICGDGLIAGAETCDDLNTDNDDGCSSACAVEPNYHCTGQPSSCVLLVGDTCSNAIPITSGLNSVAWTAVGQEYITATPSCGSGFAQTGPDVVMEFTASMNGPVDFSIVNKPGSTRWHVVVSSGPCGNLTPQVACASDWSPTVINGSFSAVQGTTYYFYIVDSTSGALPLSNPFDIVVRENVCGDGWVSSAEACDDGNSSDGDGCSSSCQVESGSTCSGEPSTCSPLYGDTCANVAPLTTGTNVLSWNAIGQEYLTSPPSCSTSAVTGPDVVMSFTASLTGEVQFSLAKPASNRWHLVVSDGACGTLTPQVHCASESTLPALSGVFPVVQGTTYFLYLVDTTVGSQPLSNPLTITLTETAEICGDGVITGGEACDDGNQNNGDGCSSSCAVETGYGCSGEPSVCLPAYGDTCSAPAQLVAGINTVNWTAVGQDYITVPPSCSSQALAGPDLVMEYTATVTGQIQYDISKPASNRWHLLISDGACGTISPQIVCHSESTLPFLAGHFPVTQGTTYYFYLIDTTGGTLPLDNPLTIEVKEVTTACTPGAGGMVGDTVSTFPSGWAASFTEQYVAVDDDPNGWVYVGGTSGLRRVPKGGGTFEDVHTLAGLGTTHLGYTMLVNGLDLFTLESKTTGTSGHIFRISQNGGASWNLEDYAAFAAVPGDDFRAVTRYGNQIFALTHEVATSPHEIFSMPAAGTPPVSPTLELDFLGDANCAGIAVDDFHYYVTCGTNNRLVRIDRTTGVLTVIGTYAALSTTSQSIHAHDLNSDGVADVLYYQGGTREVHYVCNPSGASPYFGTLATFGASTTTNFGLGFDRVANKLYAYHDVSPFNIVVIE